MNLRLQNLIENIYGLPFRKLPGGGNENIESSALGETGCYEILVILHSVISQLNYVGVLSHYFSDLTFPHQIANQIGISLVFAWEYFDGELSFDTLGQSQVDASHSTTAQRLNQPIIPQMSGNEVRDGALWAFGDFQRCVVTYGDPGAATAANDDAIKQVFHFRFVLSHDNSPVFSNIREKQLKSIPPESMKKIKKRLSTHIQLIPSFWGQYQSSPDG